MFPEPRENIMFMQCVNIMCSLPGARTCFPVRAREHMFMPSGREHVLAFYRRKNMFSLPGDARTCFCSGVARTCFRTGKRPGRREHLCVAGLCTGGEYFAPGR